MREGAWLPDTAQGNSSIDFLHRQVANKYYPHLLIAGLHSTSHNCKDSSKFKCIVNRMCLSTRKYCIEHDWASVITNIAGNHDRVICLVGRMHTQHLKRALEDKDRMIIALN